MADYASSAIREQIERLVMQRDQLVRQQEEYKTASAETLAHLSAAIAEIEAAVILLDPRADEDAILALNVKLAQFSRERAALLAKIAEFGPRDTAAEIMALDRQIVALRASIMKVPLRDEK